MVVARSMTIMGMLDNEDDEVIESYRNGLSEYLSTAPEMVKSALRLAVRSHWGQNRKHSDTPYIVHPMRVAASVLGFVGLRHHALPTIISAALLHDVIEDCGVTHSTISDEVSSDVADIVVELTNTSKQTGLPRRERKAMDREHISGASWAAKLTKLADRTDNLLECARTSPDDFKALYLRESKELFSVLRGVNAAAEQEYLDALKVLSLAVKEKKG